MMDASGEALCRQLGEFPPSTTLRTIQNWRYMGRVCEMLQQDKNLAWLHTGGSLYGRKTLISQLGRVRQDAALKIFAVRICELKPTVTEGIKLVRDWNARLQGALACRVADGDSVPKIMASVEKLAKKICGVA